MKETTYTMILFVIFMVIVVALMMLGLSEPTAGVLAFVVIAMIINIVSSRKARNR